MTHLTGLILQVGPLVGQGLHSARYLLRRKVAGLAHALARAADGHHARLVVVDLRQHRLVLLHQVLDSDQVASWKQSIPNLDVHR